MPDRVNYEPNERVDLDDRLAQAALVDVGTRALGRLVGEIGLTAGLATTYGCVVTPSSITFGVPAAADITIGSGLRLLFGNTSSALGPTLEGDGAPNGDLLTLGADTVILNGCPSVGTDPRYLMARCPLLAESDSAQRVYRNPGALPREFTAPTNTRLRRTLTATEFIVVDSTLAVIAATGNGYELVATMIWDGGPGSIESWETVFPKVTNLVSYPLGSIRSVKQFAAAVAAELDAIKGGATWDATPAGTLAQVATLFARPTCRMSALIKGTGAGILASDDYNVSSYSQSAVGKYELERNGGIGKYFTISVHTAGGPLATEDVHATVDFDGDPSFAYVYLRYYDDGSNTWQAFDLAANANVGFCYMEFA